ncbi:probable calcium-binding protein CML45 [Magnolia sinica]|uniref:probable calcium-binding protein CML45 n=1 Tax=Magnolia sinica TaxID=86752 RepID=UPI00265A8B91|nr:probable calcium-binding protein CML45 [Magnolia sinica]
MGKASPNSLCSFFSSHPLVEYFFLHKILTRSFRCEKFYYSFISFFQPQLEFFHVDLPVHSGKKNPTTETDSNQQSCLEKGGDAGLRRDDVEMVMETLGIFFNPDGEKIKECVGLDDISVLFQDDEPSLPELMEAFQVFDVDRDGFIDARELQSVLCKLGFWEASNLEVCEMMIREFDVNGDSRIDFKEFVKLMEKGFC